MTRKYGITIYGATGVTGAGAAAYLAEKAPPSVEIAIAGRNPEKLSAVAESLGRPVSIVMADSSRPDTIKKMAAATEVLISTVGPYDKYGEVVIDSCVASETDYTDITGETPFIEKMIAKLHQKAVDRGIRIVPFCGFDSVPSDMGTLFLVDHVKQNYDEPVREVKSFYQLQGGLNGGTLASGLNLVETGQDGKLKDPLILNPPNLRSVAERKRSYTPSYPIFDKDLERWSIPFFMGPVNSAVVRRSNALFRQNERSYGDEFAYHERMLTPKKFPRLNAYLTNIAVGFVFTMMKSDRGRDLLRKYGPAPGEGPSKDSQEKGFFRCHFIATTSSGRKVPMLMEHQGDPGNIATVKFLCQAALQLLASRGQGEPGGILTPAVALGMAYQRRLAAEGLSFQPGVPSSCP